MSHLPNHFRRIGMTLPVLIFTCLTLPIFQLRAQNVGVGTTEPEAGLHVENNNGIAVTGEFANGNLPIGGYGTRFMFHPKTGSFRAGRLTDEDGGIYQDWWDFFQTGDYSFVAGVNSKASGYASAALGTKNLSTGLGSFANGGNNSATGSWSFATGFHTTAPSFAEFVIGTYPILYTPSGSTAFHPADRLFVVANGTGDGNSRSNALTIFKDGKTGIGTDTPATLLDVAGTTTTQKAIVEDSLTSNHFKLTTNAGADKILVSDPLGNATWTTPAQVFSDDWMDIGNNLFNTNSANVGIGTMTPLDKLHIKGNMRVDSGRINIVNTGESVFIGQDAGLADDLTDNRNVYIGHEAGKLNVSGVNNIAIGTNANASSTAASNNISIGRSALASGTTGNENIAIGTYALDVNSSGSGNIAIGYEALGNINNQSENTAIGSRAGLYTLGSRNTFFGFETGRDANGSGNVFLGYKAGLYAQGDNKLYLDNSSTNEPLIYGDFLNNKIIINDSLEAKHFRMTQGAGEGKTLKSDANGQGTWVHPHLLFEDTLTVNLFLGSGVGENITSATDNTIMGAYAGEDLGSGYENTGFGKWSLQHLTSAYANTAFGHNTLNANTSGNDNTAVGWSALAGSTGASNVALGASAGSENTSGSQNVYIGTEAGMNHNGTGNVFLGHNAGKNASGNNKLMIDNSSTNTPLIYGDFSTNEVTVNDSLTVGKELGVATATPASTLEVNGSFATAFKTPLEAGVTNPNGTGMVWRYNTGTGTISLPGAGTCPNRIYVILNQTGATRNISTYRDLSTNNQTTISTSTALWVMSDGAQWWQIK